MISAPKAFLKVKCFWNRNMGVVYHFPCSFLEKTILHINHFIFVNFRTTSVHQLGVITQTFYFMVSVISQFIIIIINGIIWFTHNHFIGIPLSFHLSLSLKVCCNSATLSLLSTSLSIFIKILISALKVNYQ